MQEEMFLKIKSKYCIGFFLKLKNLPSLPRLAFHHEIKNEHQRRTSNEKLLQLSFEYGNVERMRRMGFGRLADLPGQDRPGLAAFPSWVKNSDFPVF